MSYYPTPGAPYVPQQPVNPYGGMGTVGLATPLPNTQIQQAQPQRPQPMNGRRMPQIGFSQSGDWDKRSGQYERGSADSHAIKMPRQHLTHDEAEEWCDSMVNADGTKGCHWTLEQTQDVAKQRNITCDPNDFWAVMNMMYSDYCQVAKRQSVDTPGFYADMAKAFLEDADAADGKAYLYWDCIADK